MLYIIGTCHWLCSVMHNSLQPCDCSLPGFSVHGIFQARILDWVSHFLLQGVFPTQGSISRLLCLLHWQAFLSLSPGITCHWRIRPISSTPQRALVVKQLPANERYLRDAGRGSDPGGGNGNPLQAFLPGKSHPLYTGSQRDVTTEHIQTPQTPDTGVSQSRHARPVLGQWPGAP